VDMLLVFLVQAAALPLSPSPGGVAGFTLGVFAALIALSGLALDRAILIVAAVLGAVLETVLQYRAGIGIGPQIAAVVMLAVSATSIGYLNLEVWTSIGLGRVYYGQGDLRRAIERIRWVTGALADAPVDAPIDEHFGRGSLLPAVACRAWLSLCLAGTGDFAEAFAWGGEGLRIAREVGGPPEQVWAAYCLSRVHLTRGDAESAMPLLEAALPLCEGRLPIYRPRIVASLGRAFTMRGDLAAALPLLEQAVAGVEAVKLLFGHPVILVWTAAAHLEAGRLAEAEGYASAALDLARRQGGRGDEAWALHALAEIGAHRAPPAPELALDRATQALARAEELAMAPLQARCHLSLAALLRQAGRVEEARDELTRATAMLGHLQMRHWMRGAHTSSAH